MSADTISAQHWTIAKKKQGRTSIATLLTWPETSALMSAMWVSLSEIGSIRVDRNTTTVGGCLTRVGAGERPAAHMQSEANVQKHRNTVRSKVFSSCLWSFPWQTDLYAYPSNGKAGVTTVQSVLPVQLANILTKHEDNTGPLKGSLHATTKQPK